ncbi:MAG TPA: sugar transferase [Flavobacterium sp.]|nr:sugar transferase [Flavobacterium sp.]
MTSHNLKIKRLFDIMLAFLGIVLLFIPLLLTYLGVSFSVQSQGIFMQPRIGQFGRIFTIYKLKTIHPETGKISAFGRFLRKYKIDEFPQLWNVLIGDMSIVGPRPDIPGYYDKLEGEEQKILELRPGITSEASIKYRNEEELLAKQENPLEYNDKVIFPDKVKMNLEYYYKHSLIGDLKIMIKTFIK